MGWELLDIWCVALGCYTLAVVSAVVPWVNAEVLMLSAVPLAGSPYQLGALVTLVALGQMTGKSIMYWVSRRATRPRAPRLQNAIDGWRERLHSHPRSALGVMLASSTLGVPPFYIVAIAAGALKVAFCRFLAVGITGRLIHFALLAFLPQLLWSATILSAAPSPSNKSASATVMIDRFLSSGKPGLTSFKARRVLTASTMGGRMSASLEAWTYLDPDGTFRFEVIREEGSGLIREHVLVAALEAEQRSRNRRETGQAELTTANYDFEVDEETRDGLVTIRLFPRRKTPMLLDGTVTVRRQDGDVVRIDGSPSERPSWWTKQVGITRRYARIAGVRVPIEMSSRADVRVAGDATFSMKYEYTMINGQKVE